MILMILRVKKLFSPLPLKANLYFESKKSKFILKRGKRFKSGGESQTIL